MEYSAARGPRRRPRPPRRPERQQILLRRGLALGGVLIVLILIVLGVKGCIDARAEAALEGYARNVTQIVEETETTSKSFFGKLTDPGKLSVTEFGAQVDADRSAMDNSTARVEGLSTPGEMSRAQNALELVYELRDSAMEVIADRTSTALGEAGSAKATGQIARQMEKLLAADVLYANVVRPEINGVLADHGIEGKDVPQSTFLREGDKWLQESAVATALAGVSGSNSSSSSSGIHGLGLSSTSIDGTELAEGAPATVAGAETPEVEVAVQNQGDSTENGITVSVAVNGHVLQGNIETLEAGETESVSIPLTPAPQGEVTLEVNVQPVPGEQLTSNNEATYTVDFE